MGDVLVHHSPESLDRIEVGAVGRHEVEPDPLAFSDQPFLRQPGMMVAGVVEEDVDQPPRRMGGKDRHEQQDRALRIDGEDIEHLGLAGLEVDGAMNIHPVTTAAGRDRYRLARGCPAAHRTDLMGRMNGVDERYCLVVLKAAHQPVIVCDERLLLGRVQLARHHRRLAVRKLQPMQQRDQPRVAVLNAKATGDPRADRARVAWQAGADPRKQRIFLFRRKPAVTAPNIEDHKAGQAMLVIKSVPGASRVIVDQQSLRHLLAAPSLVQQNDRIGTARRARFTQPIPRQSS